MPSQAGVEYLLGSGCHYRPDRWTSRRCSQSSSRARRKHFEADAGPKQCCGIPGHLAGLELRFQDTEKLIVQAEKLYIVMKVVMHDPNSQPPGEVLRVAPVVLLQRVCLCVCAERTLGQFVYEGYAALELFNMIHC